MIEDNNAIKVEERAVLEKFDGEPVSENLVERVIVVDGEVIQHDFIENGEVVATYDSLQTDQLEGGDDLSH